MKKFNSILFFFIASNVILDLCLLNNDLHAQKFCTISDLHYYDQILGTTGTAFEEMVAKEGKMFAESRAILESALQRIQENSPEFIIISGDLTRDGEKVNHQQLSAIFSNFESSSGIEIFVIPGNHDIMNSYAFGYLGDTAVATPTITPEEFSQIFSEFGFNEAIAKDDSSLSYIAEPVPGVWLFALDDCKYKENTTEKTAHGGKFSASTLAWIESKLQEAKLLNKTCVGMMHHGLLEHFSGQKQNYYDFVVDDFQSVSEMFAKNGLKIVFTGHFHATDITMNSFADSSFIFDIETGSLVSYPASFRTITLNTDSTVNISTTRIKEINFDIGDKDFSTYSEEIFVSFFNGLIAYQSQLPLVYGGYGLSESDALELAVVKTEGYKAHYCGDEILDTMTLAVINTYLNSDISGKVLAGNSMLALWTDLAPSDNSAIINLKSGNLTNIEDEKEAMPSKYILEQNYPNPFNPSTVIKYSIPVVGNEYFRSLQTTLKVYDILGNEVATLVNERQKSGNYEVKFDASNLASGIYLYKLQSGSFVQTRKLMLLK